MTTYADLPGDELGTLKVELVGAGLAACHVERETARLDLGVLDGLPEAKRFMACMVEEDPANIVVGGNSSLSLMYETVARCLDFGTP